MEKVPRLIINMGLALGIILGMLLGFPKAFADKYNTETSSSAEALGMGDAAINLSRGPYSVFYNPANIASKETKTQIQAVNFQIDGDSPMLNMGTSLYTIENLNSMYSTLKQNKNTFYGDRYSVYPNVTFNFFSIGMLYEVDHGAMVRASDGALIVKARDRFGPNASLSFRLFSGILRIGANVQLLEEGNSDQAIASPPASPSYSNYINEGTGISKNAGLTLTAPFRYFPSISLVARDIGGTKFGSLPNLVPFGSSTSPTTQPMTFDAASSLTVYLARRFEFKGEVDYRDFLNAIPGSQFRHIFMGADFVLYDFLHVRGGLMHGYPTAGIGITTKKASLDISVYSEELEDRLRGSPDTRAVLQYTWGLFK